MSDPLHYLPIHVLYKRFRDGSLTPSAVMTACLAQKDAHEYQLNAYLADYSGRAEEQADAATLAFKNGVGLGPLFGVPIALKDLLDIKGMVTTGGSPEHKLRISQTTATIAERLFAAGAICTGKTGTTEMAKGGWGTNEHFGTPWNPWDMRTHRVPGGSSAGSGVVVAAGFAAGAIGTDTGGSVRLPAAYCGIVGLKVTEGLLPLDGILPLAKTLDTPGPMTRSTLDAALMFEVLRGVAPADVNTAFETTNGIFQEMSRGVAGLKIGMLPDAWLNVYDGVMLDALKESADLLKSLGAEIVPFTPRESFDKYRDASGVISSAEGYQVNREIIDNPDSIMDRHVRKRMAEGRGISAADYLDALDQRDQTKVEFLDDFRGFDAFLSPTTQSPAIPVANVDEDYSPGISTRVGNYLGLCGLALPNGFSDNGLPTSLQIMSAQNRETMVLRIGRALERETDFSERHPF